MARKRSRGSKSNKNSYRVNRLIRSSRRDDLSITNRRLPLYPVTNYLNETEDRRRFNPTGRPVGYTGVTVGDSPNDQRKQTKARIRFRHPERLLICVKRSIRREVMFAKRKAGRSGQKRPKFNKYSHISCRR